MAERAPAGLARDGAGERASVTVWLLGVVVMVLFLTGFAVDLWQATAQRRALAGLADAAASAGSGALDERAFRAHGEVRLVPAQARERAAAVLADGAAATDLPVADVAITATPERVAVVVAGEVDVTLLRVLRPDTGPWPVEVRAVAEPRMHVSAAGPIQPAGAD